MWACLGLEQAHDLRDGRVMRRECPLLTIPCVGCLLAVVGRVYMSAFRRVCIPCIGILKRTERGRIRLKGYMGVGHRKPRRLAVTAPSTRARPNWYTRPLAPRLISVAVEYNALALYVLHGLCALPSDLAATWLVPPLSLLTLALSLVTPIRTSSNEGHC